MPHARLRIQSNEGLVSLSKAHPSAVFEVLGAWPREGRLRELVETEDLDGDDLRGSVEVLDSVSDLEIRHDGPDGLRFEVDTPRPPDHGAMGDSGVLPPFPLRLADGWLSGELVTSRSQLAAFRAELEAADIPYEVERVESEREAEASGLTDRQHEAVEAALAAGYYEIPRECTLAEVAADLDVDPSVASRLLRRAESRVMRDHLGDPGKVSG